MMKMAMGCRIRRLRERRNLDGQRSNGRKSRNRRRQNDGISTPPTGRTKGRTKRMQATARRLSVVSATSCARRRLIRSVRLKMEPFYIKFAWTDPERFEAAEKAFRGFRNAKQMASGRIPLMHGGRSLTTEHSLISGGLPRLNSKIGESAMPLVLLLCLSLLPLWRQYARLATHVLALPDRDHCRLLGGDDGAYHSRYLFP